MQKEIMAMVEEVIGSTGLEELMNSGVKEGLMTMEQAKRAEELDGMKKRFSEEIERLSEEAIKGVREAEKVCRRCYVLCIGKLIDGWRSGDEDP